MKVYLASSWRNPHQPRLVEYLRANGHEVYDFRNPPNKSGFGWEQTGNIRRGSDGKAIVNAREYRDTLAHPIARAGYEADRGGIEWADACVFIVPAGRSASWELGYATALGKLVVLHLAEEMEPELMFFEATIVGSDQEMLAALGGVVLAADPEGTDFDFTCATCGPTDPDDLGDCVKCKGDLTATPAAPAGACNCNPADRTGGGHDPKCPEFEPECTCYEMEHGHQPGCHFNRAPARPWVARPGELPCNDEHRDWGICAKAAGHPRGERDMHADVDGRTWRGLCLVGADRCGRKWYDPDVSAAGEMYTDFFLDGGPLDDDRYVYCSRACVAAKHHVAAPAAPAYAPEGTDGVE